MIDMFMFKLCDMEKVNIFHHLQKLCVMGKECVYLVL
jgi:hypothetical protein